MRNAQPTAGPGRGARFFIVGLDDTDMPDTPGTNQLARRIADSLPPGFTFDVVLRHQLLLDPRIPYTSHNGCASIGVRAAPGHAATDLLDSLRHLIREFAPPGSDPGLCILDRGFREDVRPMSEHRPVAETGIPAAIPSFAEHCQREPVHQADALAHARSFGIHLEPLGGTGDGIIGALAAVGLRAGNNDGRVVHRPGWPWPDPFVGPQPVPAILARGVDEIRLHDNVELPAHRDTDDAATDDLTVTTGVVDLGKHLRPSFRNGKVVLFVRPAAGANSPPTRWQALKLP